MLDRDSVLGRGRSLNGAETPGSDSVTGRDLGQVVVFGLQPKNRNDGFSGFLRQRPRHPHRRGGFVNGVERSEKETDLLACHHRRRAAAESRDVVIAKHARGKAMVLRRERIGYVGGERPQGSPHRRSSVLRGRVVELEEPAGAARHVGFED